MDVPIRLASLNDIEAIESLMKHSMRILGKGYYTERQIEACCQFVCVPDRQLIEDQTYYVALTSEETIIGCGGWSFRDKLHAGPKEDDSKKNRMLDPLIDSARIRAMFTDPGYPRKGIGTKILEFTMRAAKKEGFSKGVLGATLSGLEFYKSKGWKSVAEEDALLPDGTTIKVVKMEILL